MAQVEMAKGGSASRRWRDKKTYVKELAFNTIITFGIGAGFGRFYARIES